MTPHAQNIALAKLDGWKPSLQYGPNMGKRWERKGVNVPEYDLPSYTESLDALRPILLKMDEDALHRVVSCLPDRHTVCARSSGVTMLLRSSSDIAEAILRAVGKYT